MSELMKFLERALLMLAAPGVVTAFRGQADSNWLPLPTLLRRLKLNGFSSEEITEKVLISYECDVLCEANGVGFYPGSRLDLMVKLQHHGGSTRLLDVTRDLFVALWFAADEAHDDCDGELICYRANPSVVVVDGEISTWDDLISTLPPGAAIIYFPSRDRDPRVRAQMSGFLVSVLDGPLSGGSAYTDGTDLIDKTSIVVPSSIKEDLREYLCVARGMRHDLVFPDFDGFAMGNAVNRTFSRDRSNLYDGKNGLFPNSFIYPA